MNNSLEKTHDDLREKNNNLLIQKDLLQNEFHSLKNSYENEKTSSVCLVNRVNELEATVQLLNAENSRLKDRESCGLAEIAKMEAMLSQLRKEKSSLEHQLKNIELNISENVTQQAVGSDLVSDVLSKFNEERKARQAAEERTQEIEKTLQMFTSDIKYLKEELGKRDKEWSDELTRRKEAESELARKSSEYTEMSTDLSNAKILEKHLNKILSDLKEESSSLKEECDRLRKVSLETENTKIKKLQEEIDELKTMNQLYRSQRLENYEEIENLGRERDKLKCDHIQLAEEMLVSRLFEYLYSMRYLVFCFFFVLLSDNLRQKYDHQRQKTESEYSTRLMAEQRVASLEQAINLYEQKSQDSLRKYLNEIETVLFLILIEIVVLKI